MSRTYEKKLKKGDCGAARKEDKGLICGKSYQVTGMAWYRCYEAESVRRRHKERWEKERDD